MENMKPTAIERKPNTDEINIAINMLYSGTDSDKRTYLHYRYSGSTQEEAAKLTGVHVTRLKVWHEDDGELRELDSRISRSGPARTALRKEVLELMFSRNMRMIMELDQRVLMAALVAEEVVLEDGSVVKQEKELTRDEYTYLKAMRRSYSASELSNMEGLMSGEAGRDLSIVALVQQMNESQERPSY